MILVDGSNLLHRILHTPQSELQDTQGRYTGGVAGFLVSLGALVQKLRFEHFVVVAWDLGIPVHRREIYREYKAFKNSVDIAQKRFASDGGEEFLEQYQTSRNILHRSLLPKMGGLSLQVADCEADDIMAYLCHVIDDEEIFILSSDKDLLQLLNEDRTFYDGRAQESWTVDDLVRKYNLVRSQWRRHWTLARAMTGDKSDGIPGVGGVGLDAAIAYAGQIISQGDIPLERSLQTLERVKQGRFSAFHELKESAGIIKRNYDLIDLDYPIRNSLPIVRNIRASISSCFAQEADDYTVELELHEMFMRKAKTYAQYIIDSNQKHDSREYIRKLT